MQASTAANSLSRGPTELHQTRSHRAHCRCSAGPCLPKPAVALGQSWPHPAEWPQRGRRGTGDAKHFAGAYPRIPPTQRRNDKPFERTPSGTKTRQCPAGALCHVSPACPGPRPGCLASNLHKPATPPARTRPLHQASHAWHLPLFAETRSLELQTLPGTCARYPLHSTLSLRNSQTSAGLHPCHNPHQEQPMVADPCQRPWMAHASLPRQQQK
mmetsp:Transcript_151276/g.282057  ORF Transcript_151276/g.282057 Transcript_151276/m.282057 type:complete len:214 (+) Transcript_151276:405-1046(+)